MIRSTTPSASVSSAVLTIDRQFRVRGWPVSAQNLFGWSAAEALDRDLFVLLACHPHAANDPIRNWQPSYFHSTKRHRDGSLLEMSVRFEPLSFDGGDALGVITLERAEPGTVARREIDARYESVVAAMQEGVVVQGLDGSIQSCNPAAERILGLTADQLHGRTSFDPRWRAVRETGEPFPGEEHPGMVSLRTGLPLSAVVMGVHKPDGSLVWVSMNAQPIRLDPQGPHHAVVSTFIDITEARAAQDRVKRLAGLLPVCAWCKSVRNDQGYWQQIEHYLTEHTDAKFTHGLCPSCSYKLSPPS